MKIDNYRKKISSLPVEHAPVPFEVRVNDNRGKWLRTVYVRASSKQRAVFTGLMVAKFIFHESKAADSSARPYPDDGIIEWANKRAGFKRSDAA